MTSERVRSDGMRAWSWPTGSVISVPSASGTRTASPWPPSSVVPPHHPPCRQDVCNPCRQNSHVPSDHANGATTRSPFFTVRTSLPIASTTPMNSWPMRFPVSLAGIELYGQRSLPQIHARVTRTRASVASTILASGTVSTRTSCTPYITVACISSLQFPARRSSCAVLLVGDVFHPLDRFAVEHLGNRDVRHRGCRRRAVPVLFAGREPHHVSRADLLDRPAVALRASTTRGDDQRLPEWMCVPRGARARFEGHGRAADAR